MQHSIFADQIVVAPNPEILTAAAMRQASQLLAYCLAGGALMIAFIAFGACDFIDWNR